MSSSAKRVTLLGGLLTLFVIGVLAVSVVTLVKVYSLSGHDDGSEQQAVTTPATTTVQPSDGGGGGGGDGGGGGGGGGGRPPPDKPDAVNVPPPATVSPQSTEYSAYADYVQRLHDSLNLSADPCNDFYGYACGSFQKFIGFLELTLKNLELTATQFASKRYIQQAPRPVQQAATYYAKCVNSGSVVDPQRVDSKMDALAERLGTAFPSLDPSSSSTGYPTANTFGSALGYLMYAESLYSLLPAFVDTNWVNPHGGRPYALFVIPPALVYDDTYYVKVWDEIKDGYFNDTYMIIATYARYKGAQLDDTQLRADVQAILDLEYTIATTINAQMMGELNYSSLCNPFTAASANAAFSRINFTAYLTEALQLSPDASSQLQFLIMRPDLLSSLLELLFKSASVTPRTIYNYLFYRLLRNNFGYLPVPEQSAAESLAIGEELELRRMYTLLEGLSSFRLGVKRGRVNEPVRERERRVHHKHSYPTAILHPSTLDHLRVRVAETGLNWTLILCTLQNDWLIPYGNGRAFVDAALPQQYDRDRLRVAMGTFVARVLDAFGGMLSQLDWMSDATKQGAFSKVSNLVKNIAYPDWIVNDAALNAYYAQLGVDDSMNITAIEDTLVAFARDQDIAALLLVGNDTNRLDFGGVSPGVVNAWYQPERNSITFPLGILDRPFYDPNYPASINYGGMGMVAGHELTHAFDNDGVQWDGTGVLSTWIDPASLAGFNQMAECVVDEYNAFRPLPQLGIDGQQTLGENIADSGGLQAAYRAFQGYAALYGPDPHLPDSVYQWFSHDQLFFLSFAQTWCQVPDPDRVLERQLLVDPHSPSKYRVLGTLQNFPAFRSAFNCPANSVYAPQQHCQVWVSDSQASTGVPDIATTSTTTSVPSDNVPAPVTAGPDSPYAQVSTILEQTMDVTQDPCDSFYEYACNNYQHGSAPMDQAFANTFKWMIDGLRQPLDAEDIQPIRQVKQFFQQCRVATDDWTGTIVAENFPDSQVQIINAGFPFPLFDDDTDADYDWPDRSDLGQVVGLMSGYMETDTLVTPFVDYDWMEPQANATPYRLYLDQASLARPRAFYVGDTWSMFKDSYAAYVKELFLRYAATTDASMNKGRLEKDVADILDFEHTIANELMTDDDTRRNMARSYNPASYLNDTLMDSYKFIDLQYHLFLMVIPYGTFEELMHLFLTDMVLVEPEQFDRYNEAFVEDNEYDFTPRTLYNYLFFRILHTYSDYLPELNSIPPSSSSSSSSESDSSSPSDSDSSPSDSDSSPSDSDSSSDSDEMQKRTEHQLFRKLKWNMRDKGGKGTERLKREERLANEILHGYRRVRPRVGPPRFERVHYPKWPLFSTDSSDKAAYSYTYNDLYCAYSTMWDMPYANARIILEQAFSDSKKRDRLRETVGEVVANVNVAFQSMVDQLGWMSAQSKEGAYNKINQLVKNIAYPDLVLNDAQLTADSALLNFTNPNDYFAILLDLRAYEYRSTWAVVLRQGNVNRTDFNGPPGTINAWYYDGLNSLTLPIAILQAPFFDPDWPASINYGGLGGAAGHELTHAFDDEGVQWNGVGELRTWMDAQSQRGFRQMADCVVSQYDHFCPLDNATYAPACINGYETQGENIADNGGLVAAFRAYRNLISLHGQDPLLPGSLTGQYSHDQLFFLSYGQSWCDAVPSADEEWLQLLLDPHSPSKYRVLGPLQNFPAFRAAFNCPANKAYSPLEHCNVWVDEVVSVTGVPPTTTTLPPLNIAANGQSPNVGPYAEAAAYIASSVDTKQDPCNSFYEYTCGNFKRQMYFETAQFTTFVETAVALKGQVDEISQDWDEWSWEEQYDYLNTGIGRSVAFFNSCSGALPQWSALTKDDWVVVAEVEEFAMFSGFPFPLIDDPDEFYPFPNEFDAAIGLGYLRGLLGIDTFLSIGVDTTWGKPQQEKHPYSVFLDQPSLLLPRSYYIDKAWEQMRPHYVKDLTAIFKRYAHSTKTDVRADEVAASVNAIADLEYMLANRFMNGDNDRRVFSRLYNPMHFRDAWSILNETVDLYAYTWIAMALRHHHGGPGPLWDLFFDPSARIVVTEVEKMGMLNKLLREENHYGMTPNTFFDYLYLRVIIANRIFFQPQHTVMPNIAAALDGRIHIQRRPDVGRPRWERHFSLERYLQREKELGHPDPIEQYAASTGTSITFYDLYCALFSIEELPYSTARVHIDWKLPSRKSRRALQESVDNVVENVLVGFRSMMDQLSWMSLESRLAAGSKIDNLVRNVAFPDFIQHDDQLNYYSDFDYLMMPDADYFIPNLLVLRVFDRMQEWNYLNIHGGTNRTDFLAPPEWVNAWYQPELNSITFPLAILQQPFYDPNWPASINYGALGVVAGHELTHGFDDEGVQWDGVGALHQWMDPDSYAAFQRMADCVQQEYSQYCPLDPSKYQPACVDGVLTQGENIADNGGIRAAFRAYRNIQGWRGEDAQLPGNLVGQFTHDQLFFLAFTQVWCEPSFDPDSTYAQMITDPHTPSKGRVWGALQNFPAFRTAFNCPAGSVYAPAEHCDVWVSDVKLVQGVPPTTTVLPSLNIPQAPRNYSEKYQRAAKFFEDTIDTSQDPCNNFYEYACNNIDDWMIFDTLTIGDIVDAVYAYRVDQGEEIEPIEKAKMMFRSCEYFFDHSDAVVEDQSVPKDKYYQFQRATQIYFPALNSSYRAEWPNAATLGNAVGLLSGSIYADTLVSTFVDTNWEDPQGEQPYLLYVDQTLLPLDPSAYGPDVWPYIYDLYGTIIEFYFEQMAHYLGAKYNFDDVDNAVQDVLDLEWTLANYFLTPDSVRWHDLKRSYNLYTVKQASEKFPLFDFRAYMRAVSALAPKEVREKMASDDLTFVLMEPDQLAKLLGSLNDANKWGFTPAQLANWFYWRLILQHGDGIPYYYSGGDDSSSSDSSGDSSDSGSSSGDSDEVRRPRSDLKNLRERIFNPANEADKKRFKPFRQRIYRPRLGPPKRMPVEFTPRMAQRITWEEFFCTIDMVFMMELVTDRLYVDYAQPVGVNRTQIHNGAEKLMNSVLLGFRSMINQIGWMSPGVKQAAYQKMDNIVTNIAAPRVALNNTLLTEYYADLVVTENENYIVLADTVTAFNYEKMFGYLALKRGTVRDEFGMSVVLVNAWYQPSLNSITLPASILQEPFFDPDWPAAINYGSLGMVLGHELTHGFDNDGVKWDAVGALNSWLDAPSQAAFDKMAQCIIDEYSGFCPLDASEYQPNCIIGEQTQGENIADNGGLHAAFRAYRNALEVLGPDRSLPSDLVGQFSHDQLFFLSFTRPWCEIPDDWEIAEQIQYDVHSPSKYRILGTLRNFPAFQDAFNCPRGSAYAPAEHCEVWITDVSDQAQPPPPPNQVNVPIAEPIEGDQQGYSPYHSAANFLKTSMNLSADPCNNFYEYACGSYQKPVGFRAYGLENYDTIAKAIEGMIDSGSPSSAVQKLINFHQVCTVTLDDLADSIADGKVVTSKMSSLAAETGLTFTLFTPSKAYKKPPSATAMAMALAQLSARWGVDTYVTPMVDVELVRDQPKTNRLFIDQPTLVLPQNFYQPGPWAVVKDTYLANVIAVLKRYAAVTSASTKRIKAYAQKLLDFEVALARAPYSSNATLRRDNSRWNNPKSLGEANTLWSFVKWDAYYEELADVTGLTQQIVPSDTASGVSAYFMETDALSQLSASVLNTSVFDPDVVVNYLFFRLLIANAPFLPKKSEAQGSDVDYQLLETRRYDFLHGRPHRHGSPAIKPRLPIEPFASATSTACVYQAVWLMTSANARVFTDALYPTADAVTQIRQSTGRIIQSIRHSMRSMLDELDWLDATSREGAFAKVNDLQVNVAFPDYILDNAQLDSEYSSLSIDLNVDTYFSVLDSLVVFNNRLMYTQLTPGTGVDRAFFVGPPATINAWYAPELNSITFPEGILRQPYFDPAFPASMNYGGLGWVAGHELTHSFDDGGVQWNSKGGLDSWMGDASQAAFNAMAQCVIDEYSGFCPLDPTQYQPNCVIGEQTQGENIADNGGIHSSYRAYRIHTALNGPDPQLPDHIFGQLSHDQLFFLAAAQTWCQAPPSPQATFNQILLDPHSPSYYRVFGTIQNYPAFRAAFNCPANSTYAPAKHCSVWVPNNPN